MRYFSVSLLALALPAALGSVHAATDEHQAVMSADELAHLLPLADIPSIGFGTWNIDPKHAPDAVATALAAGYRHIDCAAAYKNEKEVGRGIAAGAKKAGLNRHEYWVTSKLWNTAHAPADVPKALNETLKHLGVEYLDLYLMHWPVADDGSTKSIDYLDTWAAMANLPKSLVRNIGISNFSPAQITALIAAHPLSKPYLHQYETHPYLPQAGFLATHAALGIKVTAYSPLGNTNPTYDDATGAETPPLLTAPALTAIADARSCTPAQVALAWGLKRGYSVIPKSVHAAHIKENLATDVAKCITDEDAQKLAEVLPVKRFNNPGKSWGVVLYDGLEDAGVMAEKAKAHEHETLVEHAEDLVEGVAKWGMMEMWMGAKAAWWFIGEMLGDDGY